MSRRLRILNDVEENARGRYAPRIKKRESYFGYLFFGAAYVWSHISFN